jgi:hypothetical protein
MKRRIKCKVIRLKNDALLLLFGIKPRRNRLKFNKIKVKEREITPELFNKWTEVVFKR